MNRWRPIYQDLETPNFSGIKGARISNPSRYYRQYVGILVGKDKLIYINAFKSDNPPPGWLERFASVGCDGGTIEWGVIYDPHNHEFSELATNSGW